MISYETAKQMKELGLTQKRHKSAKYYVTPDIIMDFEAIHDLKDAKAWFEKRFEEQVNWMDHFTYIPELIDLIGLQSYELTLEAAVYHYIEGKKSQLEANTPATEKIMVNQNNIQGKNIVNIEGGKATLGVLEYDKTVHIANSTLEGIEKIKEAMKQNATQSPIPAI